MLSEFSSSFFFYFSRNILYSNPFFGNLAAGFYFALLFIYFSSTAIKLITWLIQISTFIHRIGRTFKYLRSSGFEFKISLFPIFLHFFDFFVIFCGLVKFMREIVKPFDAIVMGFQVSRHFFCIFSDLHNFFLRFPCTSDVCLSFIFLVFLFSFCFAFYIFSFYVFCRQF